MVGKYVFMNGRVSNGKGDFFETIGPSMLKNHVDAGKHMDRNHAGNSMMITLWGVRGSYPSPGPKTCRFGGNTTCVSVEIGDKILILDAGTGIIRLGEALRHTTKEIFVLLTHLHTDHIVGFTFFPLIYEGDTRVHLLSYSWEGKHWSLLNLFDGCHFPLLESDLTFMPERVDREAIEYLGEHGLEVKRQALNHPGGAFGYRVEHAGRSLVFIPDNEIRPPGVPLVAYDEIVDFCRGADVLLHDAQYIDSDLPKKHGWGHSTIDQVCDLAVAAEVKHLVPFHHDPHRTDGELLALEEVARRRIAPHGISCTFAAEGLTFAMNAEEVAML